MTNAERGDVGYMELVAGYLKKIGVEAEIEALDNATIIGRASEGDVDGLIDFWNTGSDAANLDGSLGAYRTGGAPWAGNPLNYPEFDAMWEELLALTDEEEHRRMAKKLDMYIIEQHPYLWGVRVPSFTVAQLWIVGFNGEMQMGNCHWTQPYTRIWIDSQLKDEMN